MSMYQNLLFEFLQANLAKDESVVSFVENTLHVSRDGAYRRLGGRTAVTFHEAMELFEARGLKFGDFLGMMPGRVHFDMAYSFLTEGSSESSRYSAFLETPEQLEAVFVRNKFSLSHLSICPDLCLFQYYYCVQSLGGNNSLKQLRFDPNLPVRDKFLSEVASSLAQHACIPTTEIFSTEVVDSLLHPILYYWETHQFSDAQLALQLLEQLKQVLDHIEMMAASGKIICPGEPKETPPASYRLLLLEAALQENTRLFRKKNGQLMVAHILNGLNIISTTEPNYCKKVESHITNLIGQASNLTTGGEKQRVQYFKSMRKRVDNAIQNIVRKTDNG